MIKGQKIAELILDDYAKERQTTAWTAHLDAQESVKSAEKEKASADLQMWKDRQAIFDAIEAVEDKNESSINPETNEEYTDSQRTIIDKTLDEARASFAQSELKYKNADSEIASAKAKVASTLRDYQENSAIIVAPESGIITDLSLAEGLVLSENSQTSNTSGATIVSSQTIGKISHEKGQLIASIDLSEIDIISVQANQKASVTIDAYADKTFTGKVLSVDTTGSTNSSVTTYTAKVILDPVEVDIYPNMAVNAEIITSIITDVLTIPTAAITTIDNVSTVQLLKNGQPEIITIEIGESNDSQSIVKSGLSVGDQVITSTISSTTTQSSTTTTSPFSGIGRTGTSSTRSSGGMPGGGMPGGF